jgi:hypothetical protein
VNDSDSALDHFDRMTRLANALAARGIAIYEHHYFMLGFGSFRLELGTRHKRWRFSWDGKEGFLDVSDVYAPREGEPAPLVAGRSIHFGLGDLNRSLSSRALRSRRSGRQA